MARDSEGQDRLDASTIARDLRSGAIATFLGRYGDVLVQIPIAAILARLLSPSEFGVVAGIMVVMIFFQLASDMGLAAGIVQDRELRTTEIKGIFLASLALSVALSALFYALSPLVEAFYGQPAHGAAARRLSLAVLFFAANVVPTGLLRRRRQFGRLAIATLAGSLGGGSVGVALALSGAGYGALVWRYVTTASVTFVVAFSFSRPPLRGPHSFLGLRRILGYSTFQFLFNVVNYFSRNVDKFVVGRVFGSAALGYYEKSYRLMLYPLEALAQVLSRVIHPVLAPANRDRELIGDVLVRVSRILAYFSFPISAFCFVAAEDIILLYFGAQWSESVPLFRLLSLSIGLQVIQAVTGGIYQAAGRTDLLFITGAISLSLFLLAVFVGVWIGSAVGVAAAMLAAFCANFLQGLTIVFAFVLRASPRAFIAGIAKPLGLALVLVVVLVPLERLVLSSLHDFLSLASLAAIAGLVWVSFLAAVGDLPRLVRVLRRT